MTPIPSVFFPLSLLPDPEPIKRLEMPVMTCKPESQKQRLERIAVQLMAAEMQVRGFRDLGADEHSEARQAIRAAQELIKQLDALPLGE